MPHFRVSSFCTGGGCVEVGHGPAIATDAVFVRDAKDPLRSTVLAFNPQAWRTFLTGVRNGEFTRRVPSGS